ncbi:vascular endothelial growth factor receptor 1 isoform X4 [Lingula anatina]|uniref:receptor protein-tyrosine kinase n=1 Tax=Lingula anatina TaxID=7574 RepID=A0A1S3HE88_LINAN|nr:vascular endothelial growth factor receptor 1 isoform X4 [Lingula anatina]|eukprot:XP_013384387.1 vascular endothelial growth factor receptor 1 isoform X4 [Lingula anatina]
MDALRRISVLLFLFSTGLQTTVSSHLGLGVELGRCRTRCLQFLTLEVNDEECQKNGNCKMCWETCEFLQWEPSKWNVMCNAPHICFPGCKSSCEFWDHHSTAITQNPLYELLKPIQVKNNNGALRLEWIPPVSEKNSERFVYILSSRDVNDTFSDWYTDIQTADMWVEYEATSFSNLSNTKYQFQLIVVNENGTVAISETETLDLSHLHAPSHQPDNPLNISVIVERDNSSTFAYVHWQQMSAERTDYSVFWGMEDCNVNRSLPYCTIPPDYFATYITDSLEGDVEVKLNADLTFNSKYFVQVECSTTGMVSPKIVFYTPGCENPDPTFTVCLPDEVIEEDDNITVTATTWAPICHNLTYSHSENKWAVVISWPPPAQGVPIRYNVSWMTDFREGDSMYSAGQTSTTENHVVLMLPGGQHYEVLVMAVYSDPKESQYSDYLYFNLLAKVPQVEASKNGTTDGIKVEDTNVSHLLIIVSVTASAAVVIFNLVNCFICRWKRNKTIETKARAMARNNSYKSCSNSPGFYPSDQLISVQDKWEIAPAFLTFGHQLGQGAFGRVLTGSYNGKRVAIKMTKKNAPPSYKEDLLAEICLMKKIGAHPNIVSLIGSCTVREPLALVMEYMPHGNLLHFLRRCRFEGQLKTEGAKQKAIEYPMINEDGSIEQETITSKELLSFARQITLAMEYLSSKGIVHRDIAARNVLVGKDKLVKLCDFGLSRDIYKELEYHKDTSGKLPLKWMAPESLKDCVYTVQSDVWTFGILLWEIATLGASPYPNIALPDLFSELDQGTRMSIPKNCSTELYILMLQCWHKVPKRRPSFTSLRLALEDMMSQDSDYLDLDNILESALEDERDDSVQECRVDIFADKTETLLPREREGQDEEEEIRDQPFTRKRSLKQTLSQLSNILDSPNLLKKGSLKSQKSCGSNFGSPRLSIKGSIRRKMSIKHSRSKENLIDDDDKDESGCESCSETQLNNLNEEDFSYQEQHLHALKSTHL